LIPFREEGKGFFFLGISRGGLGFSGRKKNSKLNFAFTRFDTEQWWDGFSWWFWTWAFSFHEHTFLPSLLCFSLLYITFRITTNILTLSCFCRGTWHAYESPPRPWLIWRSIGKKRIITYGLDENRSAIFLRRESKG